MDKMYLLCYSVVDSLLNCVSVIDDCWWM